MPQSPPLAGRLHCLPCCLAPRYTDSLLEEPLPPPANKTGTCLLPASLLHATQILVGGIFNSVNPSVYEMRKSTPVPAKAVYSNVDLQEWAEAYGLIIRGPYEKNEADRVKPFPVNSVSPHSSNLRAFFFSPSAKPLWDPGQVPARRGDGAGSGFGSLLDVLHAGVPHLLERRGRHLSGRCTFWDSNRGGKRPPAIFYRILLLLSTDFDQKSGNFNRNLQKFDTDTVFVWPTASVRGWTLGNLPVSFMYKARFFNRKRRFFY